MGFSRIDLPLPVTAQSLGLPDSDIANIDDEHLLSYYTAALVDLKAQMARLTSAYKDRFVRPWTLYLIVHNRNGMPQLSWRHAKNNAKVRLSHELAQAYLESISRTARHGVYEYEERRSLLNARAKLIFELREFCRKCGMLNAIRRRTNSC